MLNGMDTRRISVQRAAVRPALRAAARTSGHREGLRRRAACLRRVVARVPGRADPGGRRRPGASGPRRAWPASWGSPTRSSGSARCRVDDVPRGARARDGGRGAVALRGTVRARGRGSRSCRTARRRERWAACPRWSTTAGPVCSSRPRTRSHSPPPSCGCCATVSWRGGWGLRAGHAQSTTSPSTVTSTRSRPLRAPRRCQAPRRQPERTRRNE